jgi:hypothetical protein
MKIIKKIFYPFTLLTLISIISVLASVYSLYIAISNDHTAAIYPAIVIPITLITLLFYIIDRFLITKMSYAKLMFSELIIGLFAFFLFCYQFSTIDINFFTDKEYVLVHFDAKDNSISKFHDKGLFGKELNIHNSNIIHLNSAWALQNNLRINVPTA